MEKFEKKDLFYLIITGVLLLSTVFFIAKSHFADQKYENYRAEIINRGIESSIQLLHGYIEDGDPSVSSLLSSRLHELPLKSEEREAVRAFTLDISRSGSDPDARSRSLLYAKTLLACLSENRADIRRGDTESIPLYPDDPYPTFMPESEDTYIKSAAKLLGTDNVTTYERLSDGQTMYCYRTASAYAEFRDGALIRYLSSVTDGVRVTLSDAEKRRRTL